MSSLSSILGSTVGTINERVNPSTIDNFKAMVTARRGLARANRFLVTLTPPSQSLFSANLGDILFSSLVGGNGLSYRDFITDPRDIALLCESSSIPGKQIITLDYALHANSRKVPTSYQNEDVTMVFHLTNDFYAKKLFTQWSNLIIDPKTYHLNYDDAFKSDIIIQQLDHKNIPVFGVKLKRAYPLGVNNIVLDNNDTNTQRLSVTFTFDDQEDMSAMGSTFSAATNVVGHFLTNLI